MKYKVRLKRSIKEKKNEWQIFIIQYTRWSYDGEFAEPSKWRHDYVIDVTTCFKNLCGRNKPNVVFRACLNLLWTVLKIVFYYQIIRFDSVVLSLPWQHLHLGYISHIFFFLRTSIDFFVAVCWLMSNVFFCPMKCHAYTTHVSYLSYITFNCHVNSGKPHTVNAIVVVQKTFA